MTRIFITVLFVFVLLQNNLTAQGCTDPQANNFDASAIENDGSCEYNTTNYTLTQKAILSDVVLESSGLVFFENKLWTHNDGGNPDKIYEIDSLTGEVLKTVIIVNSNNKDWEDITQDETHLYIGDFGNNKGNRTNLRVYKILKSDLASGVANPELIQFSYADQTDFTIANNNNDYDCEAFFFYNDSLHLFSKNWINHKTKHYVIPSSSGTYVANIRETMDVQGLITGADISDDGVIALLGYNPSGATMMWLCFDYQGTDFFSGNKRKILLGSALVNSQVEGITFRENGYGYISAEKLSTLDAKLLSFNSSQWTNGMTSGIAKIDTEKPPFEIFPNPFFENVNIMFQENGEYEVSLFDSYGRLLKHKTRTVGEELNWNVNTLLLNDGIYFFQIKNKEKVWLEKVIFRKK